MKHNKTVKERNGGQVFQNRIKKEALPFFQAKPGKSGNSFTVARYSVTHHEVVIVMARVIGH